MALPKLFRHGMLFYRNYLSPASGIVIYAGSCRSDDDSVDIVASGGTNVWYKTTQWGFVAGQGTDSSPTGGMEDIGDPALNKWFYIWVIANGSGGNADFLINTNPEGVFFPSGYSKKRLIGAIRRNGTNLQAVNPRFMDTGALYIQMLDMVENGLDLENFSGQATTDVGGMLKSVPDLGNGRDQPILADCNVAIYSTVGACQTRMTNPDYVGAVPSLTASPLSHLQTQAANEVVCRQMQIMANEDRSVNFRSNIFPGYSVLRVQVTGYYWPRI